MSRSLAIPIAMGTQRRNTKPRRFPAKDSGLSEINMPRAGLAQRFFHPFITLLMRTNVLSVFCHANALPHAF